MTTSQGLVFMGAWLIFMGVAGLVSLRLTRGKVGERGRAFSERGEGILRRLRLLAPASFYRAIVVPLCLLWIFAGVVMVSVGALA